MVEAFKITARELRRNLKIHVKYPDDYDQNERKYPVVIFFDGELFYNYIGEDTKVFDTDKITSDIKEDTILVFLHSPSIKEWRMSELNPYYNGDNKDVDSVLSYIYFEYITHNVLPILKQRFRILEDQVYLFGINEGAIAALSMVFKYKEYKGACLLNPTLKLCDDKINEDLKNNFTCKKSIYLYRGGHKTDSKEDDLFYHLCTRFDSLKTEILKYDFNPDGDNSTSDLSNQISIGIKHILLNK